MAVDQTADLSPGTVFDGRYEIVRAIGKGGVGVVYEVVHLETQRHRALKVMLQSKLDHENLRKRFEQEATVVAGVESEHIADVIDAGVDEESQAPYIVMELLKGEELGKMLARRGLLPRDEAVLLLAQAAVALDKTHAAGILHRDLKPENLFVTYRDDGRPSVKLLDFGIAKALAGDSDVKTTRGILGTPYYLAPEQVHGLKRQSGRTDGYALAQIAYTLLTGAPYWKHDASADQNMYGRLIAVSEGATESARERAAKHSEIDLPEAFDQWFDRATAVQPAERYGSCAESISALAAALEVTPPVILQRSPSIRPGPVAPSQPPEAPTDGADEAGESGERVATTTARSPQLAGGRASRPLWILLAAVAATVAVVVMMLRSRGGPAAGEAPPADGSEGAPIFTTSPPTAEAGSAGGAGAAGGAGGAAAPTGSATSGADAEASATVAPSSRPAVGPAPAPKGPAATSKAWTPPVTER